ncbi:hypothetical protein D3C78_661520 [compost metagenome]
MFFIGPSSQRDGVNGHLALFDVTNTTSYHLRAGDFHYFRLVDLLIFRVEFEQHGAHR